ncbi:TetR/AcrR family transcriptional regulator [Brevibacterium renqingii]|uniref:TetR/AcrR family transcriptional regulator n=1 Tax=Brevibacterium renqingii TaxID=2776916 RepID=UPI001AE00B05|nr:TetR/AcrR family transcriptional regulator [Brevibacterium renqingii]
MTADETKATVERSKRRRSNTRTRLIDAADRLFLERLTLAVGIDEICAEAGFSRGAYYSNFSSVDELFFAVYERHTARLLEALAEDGTAAIARTGGSLDEVVDELMKVIPAEFEWYALRASFVIRSAGSPENVAALHEHGEQFRKGITPYLRAAFSSAGRRFRGDEAEGVRMVIAAHVGAVLQAPLVEDKERLRRETLIAVIRGLTDPIDPAASGE